MGTLQRLLQFTNTRFDAFAATRGGYGPPFHGTNNCVLRVWISPRGGTNHAQYFRCSQNRAMTTATSFVVRSCAVHRWSGGGKTILRCCCRLSEVLPRFQRRLLHRGFGRTRRRSATRVTAGGPCGFLIGDSIGGCNRRCGRRCIGGCIRGCGRGCGGGCRGG